VLEMEADGLPASVTPRVLIIGPLPAPDRDVVDSARARLAPTRRRPSGQSHAATGQAAPEPPVRGVRHLPRPLDDLRAASAVAQAAGPPGQPPAEPLDVGAALVLLSNVRLYLDQLEASLLDLAQQADMSWDLIAAIIGVPAAEAEDRLMALRARPTPE
jgi:hypothetical protein